MVKNSWEIIKNIFNDIPSSWGLAISQWSGMFHNLNTIVSDYLSRLFFLLSLLISAIVDSHIGESSLPTCYFPKQREGTTRPSSRQAHVTCDLLFWKIPQLSAKPQQRRKKMTLGSPKVQEQRPPSQFIWAHQGQVRASLAQRSKHWSLSGLWCTCYQKGPSSMLPLLKKVDKV